MNKLLREDVFDGFLLEEATVSTATTVNIDGHVNAEFFGAEDKKPAEELIPWKDTKELIFNLIKGKRTPLYFKFVLHMNRDQIKNCLVGGGSVVDSEHVKSLVLGIKYDSNGAVITTGTSYRTFVMTKEPDKIWDEYVKGFLLKAGIDYEEL